MSSSEQSVDEFVGGLTFQNHLINTSCELKINRYRSRVSRESVINSDTTVTDAKPSTTPSVAVIEQDITDRTDAELGDGAGGGLYRPLLFPDSRVIKGNHEERKRAGGGEDTSLSTSAECSEASLASSNLVSAGKGACNEKPRNLDEATETRSGRGRGIGGES